MEYWNIEQFDLKEFSDKLKNYERVAVASLAVGDHIRYTSNKYKEVGRKCCYSIIKEVNEDGTFTVNGYSPNGVNQYPDWKLDTANKFKRILVWKKKEDENQFNDCVKCGGTTIVPHVMCIVCKNGADDEV